MKHFCSLTLGSYDITKETVEYRRNIQDRGNHRQGDGYNKPYVFDTGMSIEQEDDGPLKLIAMYDDPCFNDYVEINYCPVCGYKPEGMEKTRIPCLR